MALAASRLVLVMPATVGWVAVAGTVRPALQATAAQSPVKMAPVAAQVVRAVMVVLVVPAALRSELAPMVSMVMVAMAVPVESADPVVTVLPVLMQSCLAKMGVQVVLVA